MMDDPLKRRMFAQPVRANQPMGILASSPQLMNAVQGYANGGAVKGYQAGGYEVGQSIPLNQIYGSNIQPLSFDSPLYKGIGGPKRKQQAIENRRLSELEKLKKSGFDDTQPTISINEAQKSPSFFQTPEPAVEKIQKKKSSVVEVDDLDKDKSGKVKPTVSENAQIQEPGAVINETNEKLTQTDKELKDNIPKGKNLGSKPKPDFVTEAANTFEKHKEKLGQVDARYTADETKRTNYMKKIEDLMEEEEDEIDLNSVDEKAREVLGLKEGEYDDDKVTAFWMSLIKGGLATAAGESANALTNVAKGLMFGVDSYGKDMNRITLQEREDRQNLAKMRYNLIKDEKAAKTAERTLRIQGYGELAKIEENKFQFRTELEYKTERNKILDEMAYAKLDLTAAQTLHTMKLAGKTYDLKIEELALNKQKQDDYVRLTEKQLTQQLKDKQSTKEIKNIYALGADYATYEDGQFSFTEKGKAMLIAATASKTKFTDLVTTAKAIGANKVIEGYKYETSDKAEDAYYYYEGVVKPQLKKLDELSKKLSGGIDAAEYDRRKQALMKQFAKDTGGVFDGSTGGGSTGGNYRKMPQAVIEKNFNEGDTFTSNGIKYIVGPNNTYTEAN
jgi:hypothetical protein